MQLEEFQTLATMQHLQLAKEFSFLDKWSISFDNAKRRAGACNLTNKEILVSRSHIKLNSKKIVLDTLLHEFAHAIAYELFKEVGHGTQWKRVAKQLGAIPKSTGKFKMPESPWLLVFCCKQSKTIEKIATRHRRNRKIKSYYLKNRPSTQGNLYYLPTEEYNLYCDGDLPFDRLNLTQ